ncbi:hypothetical protein Ac2012v2_000671 [Leucoagaricus gongylophorus]
MRREIPTPPPCSRLHAHRPSHGNYPISPLAQPLTRPQNDDGPPSPTESPYVLGLYQLLSQLLGLLSVPPSPASHSSIRLEYQGRPSQHPEILDRYRTSDLAEFTSLNHSLGKAYHIKETIRGVYYYPTNQGKSETSAISRPLKDGELHIWHNWGQDKDSLRNGEVDLYSINIPLIDRLLTEEGLKIYWTNIWRNSYGRLFKAISAKPVPRQVLPDALANGQQQCENKTTIAGPTPADSGNLLFHWAPEMKGLIAPSPSMLPVGSDGWAIYHGYVSVTPLCANFGEPHTYQNISIEDRFWKIKL